MDKEMKSLQENDVWDLVELVMMQMQSNTNANYQNFDRENKIKVYSKIWTCSIPFHTQEPKHSATTIVAAGTCYFKVEIHNPAPLTLTLLTIHNPAPDLPSVQSTYRQTLLTIHNPSWDLPAPPTLTLLTIHNPAPPIRTVHVWTNPRD